LAQSNVYSLNVVGYHNISTTAGQFKLIANQLNTANNSIGSILTNVPHGTFFYKYNAGWGTFDYDTDLGGWDPDGNATLNPGEGGLIKTPSAITITFVGEVLQGSLSNNCPSGFAVRSSMVPQAGLVSTDLGFPQVHGDNVYKYSAGWGTYAYDSDIGWDPNEPSFAVGEAFMTKQNSGAKGWVRNFTVQ
jgi:hypothetical protein